MKNRIDNKTSEMENKIIYVKERNKIKLKTAKI